MVDGETPYHLTHDDIELFKAVFKHAEDEGWTAWEGCDCPMCTEAREFDAKMDRAKEILERLELAE